MKTSALFTSLALLASISVEAHGHSGPHHFVHRRHAAPAMAKRSDLAKRRLDLQRRKTPGTGDSTSLPDNAAEGSDSDECAIWHTVIDGEVCLGLIDKSSSGFDLEKFHKLNPSVNDDCSNLENGQAYCVDTEVGGDSEKKSSAKSLKTEDSSQQCSSDYDDSEDDDATPAEDSDDDEEDCEEEDEDDYDDDDEDCEEEDEDDDDTEESQPAPTTQVEAHKEASSSQSDAPSSEWSEPSASPEEQQPAQSSDSWEAPSSSAPEPSSGGSSGGSGGGSGTSGAVTYYYQKGNAGACGDVNPDSAMIAAVYPSVYQDGAACGKTISISNDSGATIEVTIADLCPSCEDANHIDLSEAAFKQLGTTEQGMVDVTYAMSG